MKKFLSIIILFVSVVSYALPVDEGKARNIASTFFSGVSTRASSSDIELVWAGRTFPKNMQDFASSNIVEGAGIYVYNRTSSDGFVVVSGETGTVPVIAFSHERAFDFRNMAPGTRALMQGWCRQIQAVREGKAAASATGHEDGEDFGNIVVKHDTPLWGQDEPYNKEAPVFDGGRCVTGCVATAMSIVAYCNRYPVSGTGTVPEYTYDGITIPAHELGRKYDYDNMLMDYSGGYTEKQGDAVAALMKDMGVAVQMMYGVNESGAYDMNVLPALTRYFGYSRNALMLNAEGYYTDEWLSMLKENISAYGPTYYSGAGEAGGHAFVLDGYTDYGYFSINYGWNGANNGYYYLPQIEFYDRQMALMALAPDPQGTSSYRDLLSIYRTYDEEKGETLRGLQALSENYQTGVPGKVRLSAVINQGMDPFNGEIKLSLCDMSGNIKEDLLQLSVGGLEYQHYMTYDEPFEICIKGKIEEGDRLRLFYKGKNSDLWQWARGYDRWTDHEAVICASPEQVAGSIELGWSKVTGKMGIIGSIPVQMSIEGNGYSVSLATPPFVASTVALSAFPSGEYLLKISSGSDPYEVVIVL